MNIIESRYRDALHNIPAPGQGCHPALLSVANLGVMAEIEPHELHDEIRQSIRMGSRRVKDREITEAISKALSDHSNGTYTPKLKPEPIVKDGEISRQRIIQKGAISNDADLWEESPVKIHCLPEETPGLLLSTLFELNHLVWIGEHYDDGRIGETIRTVAEWVEFFGNGGKTGPHIIINPLDGVRGPKKSGDGETLRGDHNVFAFRYCLVEFDDLSREDQIRFWSAVKLPIVALIDTGGKSIHAWVQVSKLAAVSTPEQWQDEIKRKLYDRILTPLGVDAACSNPSRLSRLPGHIRDEKQTMQRLLWLSSEGRPVC